MYDININFTVAGNTTMTFPTLKLMKDFIKQALQPEDGSLKGLYCINLSFVLVLKMLFSIHCFWALLACEL